MKTRWSILMTVMGCGLVAFVWSARWSAEAGGGAGLNGAVTSISASIGAGEGTKAYSYLGSKKCKICHIKSHKSWAKTKMGRAFETLKPGQAEAAKEKFGLDVKKDYTKDANCLKCHTTGFGEPGGYAIPDPNDKKAVRRAKKLEGVGCESCHGPGSAYAELHKEIMKSKRTYKIEEMYAAGMRKLEEKSCLGCHNEMSPTIDADGDFKFDKNEGIHEHETLKQREG